MNSIYFNKKYNYVTAIYKKRKINNNIYEYIYDGVVFGYLDSKNNTFKDNEGKRYQCISNNSITNSNKLFINCLSKNDLELVFSNGKNLSMDKLIQKYIDYTKSLMYYVRINKDKNGNTKSYIKEVNIDNLEEMFDILGNNVELEDNQFLIGINTKHQEANYLDPNYIMDNKVIDDLNNLIINTYNCEYNSEQLITLAKSLGYLKSHFEGTLDTIDLQLRAYFEREKKPLHPTKYDEEFINSTTNPFDDSLDLTSIEYLFSFDDYMKTKNNLKKMDLIKLKEEIKKYLINQDDALRRVLVEIARMDIKGNENNKGILLLGDSGVGKTYLMELLAKNLDVPILIIDSTQLTVPGYVGKDIQEYLWDLYEKCDKDIEKAENAIVFFDEIDKKGSNRKSDASGQGVLNVLLKFLDGTTYDVCRDTKKSSDIVKMNTSRMKVIAGGAFTDLFTDEKKNTIGFNSKQDIEDNNNIPNSDDFIKKAFMTREFMGRFPIRIKLNKHNVDSFAKILKESNSSTLKEEEKAFKKLGIKLSVTDEFVKLASSNAIKLKTGVRGLMSCIEEATWVAFEDCYNNPNKYEEIILTKDTINDPSNYQKVLKK